MKYTEQKHDSLKYKEEYLGGIESVIKSRQEDGEKKRCEFIRDIFTDPEGYREEFKKMLGWPLAGHNDKSVPSVKLEELSDEDEYILYRATFDVVEQFKITGLFFKLKSNEKLPLVIVQHGGLGTPEFISGMYEGKTGNYNDMLMRVLERGVHVFAPQLAIWDPKEYGADFDRAGLDARLKRVGSSIAALEVYALTRVIDYFEAQDFVRNFGMVGLSYGGFYTLFTVAADTRIKSAISCSFFNKRDMVPWTNWVWKDSAYLFDDAEIACLVYPRRICLQMGDKDQLFDAKYSKESFEKIKKICKDVGTDWVELIVFDGKHEFYKGDEPIDVLINDLK